MAEHEHTLLINKVLEEGPERWNQWRLDHPDVKVDQSGVNRHNQNLRNCNFDGVDFRQANLTGVSLTGCSFRNADLSNADLTEVDLRGIDFSGARMIKTKLEKANLQDAQCERVTLNSANMVNATLQSTNFEGAELKGANLSRTSLINANLTDADLSHSTLHETDLRNANLQNAILDRSSISEAKFEGVYISGASLKNLAFTENHRVMLDGSEFIKFSKADILNWSLIRKVGELPFFAVSWTAFLFTLIGVNSIGWLNHHQFLNQLDYPIPIPQRMMLILLDTILLVIGSTLYRFRCPQRVQEFSENQWVEEHGHPRLMYIGDKLDRRKSQIATAAFLMPGIVLALWLIGERLLNAAIYIWDFEVR